MSSPLRAVLPGWPWKAAAAVRSPELAYRLSRVEATFRRYPTSSNDRLRAAQVEIEVLESCSDRFLRRAAQVLGVITTLGVLFGLSAASGITHQLLATLPSITTRVAAAAIGGVVVLLLPGRVARWIDKRLAHRAVLARDRLDRWLIASEPPVTTDVEQASRCPA